MSTTVATIQTPRHVLEFWFGENKWGNFEAMDDGQGFSSKAPLWWGMKPDYSSPISADEKRGIDESCRQFSDLIRLCGRNELPPTDWDTPDGWYAAMLLCDQLSRNCFRGTSEAFAYDSIAVSFARKIVEEMLHESYGIAAFQFLATPGQHSEALADHEMNQRILDYLVTTRGGDNPVVRIMETHISDHKAVIDRFGRYPHRNRALGRESTEDELLWLADVDNLPGWAKSQM